MAAEEIFLFDLVRDVWRRKWLVMGVAFLAACVAAGLSLLMPNWYTAEVLLAPAEERTTVGIAGPLGSLANLAGISVGGGDTAEANAVLNSRDLARTYIQRENLLTVFFAKQWDATQKKWKQNDPEDQPDIRDAVRYWDRNLRTVSEDRKTKLVRLTVEWKDPVLAAKWANEFADLLNDRMRQRALTDAQTSIVYLREELGKTNEVVLQQSISRLIESEMQKITMARGNPEFAFKVIDRAEVPKRKSSPQRVLIVFAAAFLGGATTVAFVLWGALQRRRGTTTPTHS
jgi:uncharacterized protein involved in exopolysaccharide biosynthesis